MDKRESSAFPSEREARDTIIEIGRRMYGKGFVAANDGNISCRVGPDIFLTTCSGVSKGFLTDDMLVKVNGQGEVLAGNRKASSELKMHLSVYRENPEIMAVTHAHPLICTAFAIAGISLDKAILPEAVIHLGTVPVIGYAVTGSKELAAAVSPFCRDYNGVLLANHGALSWGRDGRQGVYCNSRRRSGQCYCFR